MRETPIDRTGGVEAHAPSAVQIAETSLERRRQLWREANKGNHVGDITFSGTQGKQAKRDEKNHGKA